MIVSVTGEFMKLVTAQIHNAGMSFSSVKDGDAWLWLLLSHNWQWIKFDKILLLSEQNKKSFEAV